MKILIYCTEVGHSTNRLMEEIKKAENQLPGTIVEGEVVPVFDLYSYVSETTGHDRVYKRGVERSKKLISKEYQAVIPRLAGAGFDFGVGNVRHLTRNLNIFSTSSDIGMKLCSNKFLTVQTLSEHGWRVPRHVLAHRPTDYKELIDLVGGLPCVAKLQRGSQGAGVFILNDVLAASTALRAMEQISTDVVLTRFIDSGSPANDIRIFVIGAETLNPKIFAYRRFSVDEDFRSNYSISKKGEKITITEEEELMAIQASKLLGGGIHGVDIMRDTKDDNKPYIIEVNSSPGLEGIEAVTGENVAAAIIQYVLDNYKRGGHRKETNKSGATMSAPAEPTKQKSFTSKLIEDEKAKYPAGYQGTIEIVLNKDITDSPGWKADAEMNAAFTEMNAAFFMKKYKKPQQPAPKKKPVVIPQRDEHKSFNADIIEDLKETAGNMNLLKLLGLRK